MKLQRLFCLVALISAVSMASAAKQDKETSKENAVDSPATAKAEKDTAADENVLAPCWSARQCSGKSRPNFTIEACKRGSFGKSWGRAPGPGCKTF
ncbi:MULTISPECIES: hypothetical protein [unclassified Janthinobacterium]|uniref:hypothetical protein n=1 Tax=unclassified Janthinobacterium TaxID=2610881 RepID=UPI001E602642|nr:MULTISPECIES: hypothetical protein [unclassified Janthinobacterium]MCC7645376.1 hypothetical protein [Janthinobacterium sp. EB271-G4-3-1]MCC7690432.1 hypothetical protein [Janthinobacterium sp. EB271-G4-3-2]